MGYESETTRFDQPFWLNGLKMEKQLVLFIVSLTFSFSTHMHFATHITSTNLEMECTCHFHFCQTDSDLAEPLASNKENHLKKKCFILPLANAKNAPSLIEFIFPAVFLSTAERISFVRIEQTDPALVCCIILFVPTRISRCSVSEYCSHAFKLYARRFFACDAKLSTLSKLQRFIRSSQPNQKRWYWKETKKNLLVNDRQTFTYNACKLTESADNWVKLMLAESQFVVRVAKQNYWNPQNMQMVFIFSIFPWIEREFFFRAFVDSNKTLIVTVDKNRLRFNWNALNCHE